MKKSKPLVSFVICEHNTPIEYFREAILSVVNQTYKNIEIIIVNDKTKIDLSNEELLKDPRIIIINNNQNLGLAASRNIGISYSKGEYIAIMDTDDICFPKRIEKQVNYMEKHKDVICAGSYVQLFGKKNLKQRFIIPNNEKYRCMLFFGNYPTLINPSSILRKSALIMNDIKYNEELKTAEDYMMWVTLSDIGKVKMIKKILLKYRIRDGQMTETFKTFDLGENGKLIRNYQLRHLGYDFISDKNDVNSFYKYAFSNNVNTYDYYCLLKRLLEKNKKTNYYNQKIFKKVVKCQWKMKIYSTPLKRVFTDVYRKVPFNQKAYISIIELIRPFNLLIKIYQKLRTL